MECTVQNCSGHYHSLNLAHILNELNLAPAFEIRVLFFSLVF